MGYEGKERVKKCASFQQMDLQSDLLQFSESLSSSLLDLHFLFTLSLEPFFSSSGYFSSEFFISTKKFLDTYFVFYTQFFFFFFSFTTAWSVLGLRTEERPPDAEESCGSD